MIKKNISTPIEKKKIIDAVISAIVDNNNFLILGHQNPDEDCISSMVAIALIINKFGKAAMIFISSHIHEHFNYLLNICEYNSIDVIHHENYVPDFLKNNYPEAVIICDTAKKSMVDSNDDIQAILKDGSAKIIEIDHHIGADSEYIGNDGLCLVTDATSASELVGQVALSISEKKELLKKFNIDNFFTRNLVLAILTGIVGDTHMGKYIKSRKEKKYYRIFSELYNDLLAQVTTKKTNLSNITEVFSELSRLSAEEENCYNYMMSKKKFSKSVGYVVLGQEEIYDLCCQTDTEVIVSVARAVADALAEESGKLSLVAYYDDQRISNLVQLRIRRSHLFKEFDTRSVLKYFSITNGGGHEGAIGFRVPKSSIENLDDYIAEMIRGIEDNLLKQV